MTQSAKGGGIGTAIRRGALFLGAMGVLVLPWGSGSADARPMRVLPSSAAIARSLGSHASSRVVDDGMARSEVLTVPPVTAPLPRCASFRPPVEGTLQLRTAYRGAGKNSFKFCPKWSGFGPVRGRVHGGVDISATTGSLVYAAADGVVDYARDPGGYGLFARLRFREERPTPGGCVPGQEIAILYAHLLDEPHTAHPSRLVKAGDVLGRVGCSGNAKGMCTPSPESHVHVTVERGPARQRIDPAAFLGWKIHVPEDAPLGLLPCRLAVRLMRASA